MRKLATTTLRTAVLSVLAVSALGATAVAQTPTQDSFAGTAILTHSTDSRFDVRSGPSGENPTGSGTTSDWVCCGYPITAISCLVVTGNKATFVAALGLSEPFGDRFYTFMKLTGVDNGTPSGDNFDLFGLQRTTQATNPYDCSHLPDSAVTTNTDGDFTVVDASPSSAADLEG